MATKVENLTQYTGPAEMDMLAFLERPNNGTWLERAVRLDYLQGLRPLEHKAVTFDVADFYAAAANELLADISGDGQAYAVEYMLAKYVPGASPLNSSIGFQVLGPNPSPIHLGCTLTLDSRKRATVLYPTDAIDAAELTELRAKPSASFATGDGSITFVLAYSRFDT